MILFYNLLSLTQTTFTQSQIVSHFLNNLSSSGYLLNDLSSSRVINIVLSMKLRKKWFGIQEINRKYLDIYFFCYLLQCFCESISRKTFLLHRGVHSKISYIYIYIYNKQRKKQPTTNFKQDEP